MTSEYKVVIDPGEFGNVITRAMARLHEMGAPGGAPIKGGGGGKVDPPAASEATQKELALSAEQQLKSAESMKGFMGRLGKTLGIQVGLSSILKQSQIFTSSLGGIFQIAGALVDVILAPFLPIIVPAIRMLASFIPMIYSVTTKISAWIQEHLNTEKIDGRIDNIGEWIFQHIPLIPQHWKDAMTEWWTTKDWGDIAVIATLAVGSLLAFTKIGKMIGLWSLVKGMWSVAKLIAKIPGVKTVAKSIGKGASAVGKWVGRRLGFGGTPKPQGTLLKTQEQLRLERLQEAKKAGRGMFGKFASKMNPMNMLKGATPLSVSKFAFKKIPLISGLIIAGEGIIEAAKLYKTNTQAGEHWGKALLKATAVGATGITAGALTTASTFIPYVGPLISIGAAVGADYAIDKVASSLTINVDGQQGMATEISRAADDQARRQYEGANVTVTSGVAPARG